MSRFDRLLTARKILRHKDGHQAVPENWGSREEYERRLRAASYREIIEEHRGLWERSARREFRHLLANGGVA